MPRAHQITTHVLARPDEIPRRFLTLRRNDHGRELADPDQPSDPLGIRFVFSELPDDHDLFMRVIGGHGV